MRQLGYLGKVPHRGDFVRYNVPTQLHRVWDDWLAEVLLQAADALDGWPDGYDAAPAWQFALSPDIAGDEAHAGVLIASRDGVGRRYPFALLATLTEATTPLETLASDPALDALERLARHAVDDADGYERLKSTLGELQETLHEPPPDPDSVPFRPGSSTRAAEPAVFSEDAELLADRAGTTRLLDAVLRQSTGPYSVWRRRDGETADGRLLVSGGLPREGAAFALFGAEWSGSAGGRLDGSARTDTRRPQEARAATAAPSSAPSPATSPTASPAASPAVSATTTAATATGAAGVGTVSGAIGTPPADAVDGGAAATAVAGQPHPAGAADCAAPGDDVPANGATDAPDGARTDPARAADELAPPVPGATPPDATPPDAMPPDALPSGAVPSGAVPPGAVPSAAVADERAAKPAAAERAAGHTPATPSIPPPADPAAPAAPAVTPGTRADTDLATAPLDDAVPGTMPLHDAPLEVETLSIEDEGDDDAPWDTP